MRLVCPKCAAQYEVDDSAIPDSGRDVQCANCGDTWFQEPPVRTESATDAAGENVGETMPEPAGQAETETAPGTEPGPDTAPDRQQDHPDQDQQPPRGQQAKTDTSVLDILRREAELDAAARSGMPIPDDAQTGDDSLPEFALTAANARRRRQRLHLQTAEDDTAATPETDDKAAGKPDSTATEPAPQDTAPPAAEPESLSAAPKRKAETGASARADTGASHENSALPDVESLNSTLRSADDSSRKPAGSAASAADSETAGRGGRSGFSLAVLLAVILFATYTLSPRIETALPASKPYLESYVGAINQARLRLADGLSSVVTTLKGDNG